MLLSDVLSQYVLEHDLRPCSVEQLDISIGRYSAWLTRSATVDDLTTDCVNSWIVFLQAGQARETVRSKRRSILTLWQFAFDIGVVEHQALRGRMMVSRSILAQAAGVFRPRCDPPRSHRGFVRTSYPTSLVILAGDALFVHP